MPRARPSRQRRLPKRPVLAAPVDRYVVDVGGSATPMNAVDSWTPKPTEERLASGARIPGSGIRRSGHRPYRRPAQPGATDAAEEIARCSPASTPPCSGVSRAWSNGGTRSRRRSWSPCPGP